MIPGRFSKLTEDTVASAATISPIGELVYVTGTTSIATITVPPTGGFSTMLVIVPKDGTVATLTSGNIAVAVNCAQNKATAFFYSVNQSKWYPDLSA